MIFQCTDNPTRSSNSKMYSCCDSERDSFFDNCVVDFMVTVTCVKIETRKDNRSEVCLVKCDNRKYNILCGSIFKKQVEISLFYTRHLIGWIWKFWNLLFQFCHLISFHCLGGPAFSKRTVMYTNKPHRNSLFHILPLFTFL